MTELRCNMKENLNNEPVKNVKQCKYKHQLSKLEII